MLLARFAHYLSTENKATFCEAKILARKYNVDVIIYQAGGRIVELVNYDCIKSTFLRCGILHKIKSVNQAISIQKAT
jgi:hypothetical protein